MLFYLDNNSKFKPLNSGVNIKNDYKIEAKSPEEAKDLWNKKELDSVDFKKVKNISINDMLPDISFTVVYDGSNFLDITLIMSMEEIIPIFQSYGLIYDKRFEDNFFSPEMYNNVSADTKTLAPSIIFRFSQDDYRTMLRYSRDEIKLEEYIDIINKDDKLAYLKIMKEDQIRLKRRLNCVVQARGLYNAIYKSLSDDELLKYAILETEDDSDEF